MQRKRANCFIYKAKFLVLSFFLNFNIKMSPISWRILHVCFCYFYSVAILYNFIHFILYFYTVCTTKICFFFGGSGISALFYWYLRFRPAILNVCVMLQMLLLVYNCWLFFLLLSLQESSTTQKNERACFESNLSNGL